MRSKEIAGLGQKSFRVVRTPFLGRGVLSTTRLCSAFVRTVRCPATRFFEIDHLSEPLFVLICHRVSYIIQCWASDTSFGLTFLLQESRDAEAVVLSRFIRSAFLDDKIEV